MILSIILGLIGLGIVVFVHELGHFLAARAVGVEVEAFSLGWGPRLAGFKRGGTDYRLSVFPIGGYCKMKGEDAFRRALEEKLETIPREPGTFYGASPLRRIIVSLAGPASNVVFALIVFIIVAWIGYTVPTHGNRIVLASEYSLSGAQPPSGLPADRAGLESGDRIISADGRPISDYADIQETIALAADRELRLGVEREGRKLELSITPNLDKDSGAGVIGIYAWIDPLIATVGKGSAAEIAGIEAGDRIVSINGRPVRHVIEALSYLSERPERAVFGLLRGGRSLEAPVVLSYGKDGNSNLGIGFETQAHVVKSANLPAAFGDGLAETWKTFSSSLKGLAMLFRGVNVLKAVSGPARITWLVGQTATQGLETGGASGLAVAFDFLALLSVGLFIMNLLPIPALDGGQILMFVVEGARRKALKTTTIYRFQYAGAALILALFVLATVSDFIFFAG